MSEQALGVFRGITTAFAMLAFLAVAIWAWSAKRRTDFSQAARLPLDDDEASPP